MWFVFGLLLVSPQHVFGQSPVFGQCGGQGWTGATSCASGSCCTPSNEFYSQCLPCDGGGQPTTRAVTTTTGISTTTTTTPSSGSFKWPTFSNVKIFGPGSNFKAPGVLYPRTEVIGNTLFATAENYNPFPPVSPIYKSTNGGLSWTHVTDVKDTKNGWGLTWEPHLYVLPSAIGQYPAGTLLLAVDSVPTDRHAYNIDLYASRDQGVTWNFVSNIAKTNGRGDMYEPFLVAFQGQLICYFSDGRDSKYSQKLTHVTSSNLVNWSANVDDVTGSVQSDRPGMPTVAALPNGKWIMTYENGKNTNGKLDFPIYYKIADSPLNFLSAQGQALKATDGTVAGSGSPYVVWSSAGGGSGTVIVSFAGSGDVFTNKNLGSSNSWVRLRTNAPGSYSRALRVLPDPSKLLIVGAGYNGNTLNSAVRADVISIS
ncbi:Sialidase [Rhexocercosporidium sp. MPI-PUGE-AT-0058]|nr:Sialidase [Rhexocercosporidium sp. MPI-PUGE-AT-0058]